MAVVVANRVRFISSTVGTGAITVDAAAAGFFTPAQAGVPNGSSVGYVIEQGIEAEVGQGTYSAGVLSRDTVEASTSGGAKINLNGGAAVFFTMTVGTLVNLLAGLNFSTLPTADPGGGKLWLNGGVLQVGA